MKTCCYTARKKGNLHKGRETDGRRAYRCPTCGRTWCVGGIKRIRFSDQRPFAQFADTGAFPHSKYKDPLDWYDRKQH